MSNDDWSEREIDSKGGVDREIDRLKRVYDEHLETLSELAASAPTKALARKYRGLIADINRSILGLEDPGAIVSRSTSERPVDRPETPHLAEPRSVAPTYPKKSDSPADVRLSTAAGYAAVEDQQDNALGRIGLILGLAIVVIVLLAIFVWKYGSDDRSEPAVGREVTEASAATSGATEVETPAPPITATPEAQDFGVVYKGTRVVKEFEVFNNTEDDVSIELERSKCRCLWFDYPALIPAGGRISLSVAVDGGRAEEGLLSEGVVISTTGTPRVATEVLVTAEIR